MSSPFALRPATPGDVSALQQMIRGLAEFERLSHLCVGTEAQLHEALFGPRPVAEALLATKGAEAAGFALFFQTYSTFLARRGLWLEDLFVWPAHRGQGCGKQLLRAVAAIACERDCGRFEWAVLDWNRDAIGFYESVGATVLPDWRVVRVTGPALAALAGRSAPPA